MNEEFYSGKTQRISKLKDKNGNFFFLAMDHQLSIGRIPKLDSYSSWIKFANENDISGIVLNKGALTNPLCPAQKSIILQTIGAPSIKTSVVKIKIASIEDAIRFDATAISIQVNFEEKNYLNQLELCVTQIEKASEYGFPVLCMVNLTTNANYTTLKFINYIKFCAELGCDLIKLPLPKDIESNDKELLKFIKTCPPLLLAGGAQNDDFILQVQKSKALGFKGVCVGRNIFDSKNPVNAVSQIKNVFCE